MPQKPYRQVVQLVLVLLAVTNVLRTQHKRVVDAQTQQQEVQVVVQIA